MHNRRGLTKGCRAGILAKGKSALLCDISRPRLDHPRKDLPVTAVQGDYNHDNTGECFSSSQEKCLVGGAVGLDAAVLTRVAGEIADAVRDGFRWPSLSVAVTSSAGRVAAQRYGSCPGGLHGNARHGDETRLLCKTLSSRLVCPRASRVRSQ